MAGTTALPPHHILSQEVITQSTAHSLLSNFLAEANINPAYQPDSTLSERGPQSNSTAGNPNLTLHHLNRIKLSLEGTELGVDVTAGPTSFFRGFKELGYTSNAGEKRKGDFKEKAPKKRRETAAASGVDSQIVPVTPIRNQLTHPPSVQTEEDGAGWMDKEDFERDQDDLEGEVGDREGAAARAVMGNAGIEEVVDERTGDALDVDGEGVAVDDATGSRADDRVDDVETPRKKLSKEERKAQKKARRKEEKSTVKQGKSS